MIEWHYKVIYEDGVYKLVEYYPELKSWAELGEEAESLEELEKATTDEYIGKITAIRKYDGTTKG